jgi:hypothetical protein
MDDPYPEGLYPVEVWEEEEAESLARSGRQMDWSLDPLPGWVAEL